MDAVFSRITYTKTKRKWKGNEKEKEGEREKKEHPKEEQAGALIREGFSWGG